LHPELLHLGFVHLRSYGLMMAVAFVVGTFLGLREARRLGLDEDRVVNVILVTLIASVFGARMLYVLEHLPEFRREWTSVLALWQGGLTLYGGIAAGTFAGLVAARRMRLPVWITADALTPALALGTMFGRIGCFLNGCCYGRPTTLPWGVVFPHDSFAYLEYGDQPVHPSQLYNALAGLLMFLLFYSLRHRFRVPGVMFWSFIVLFALVRIPIDFTRTYEPDTVFMHVGPAEVTESQLMSAGIVLFGVLMILRLRRNAPRDSAPARALP
jgi:phosphatidylglycerol---prolipoprotein diacylglyceryl transferase